MQADSSPSASSRVEKHNVARERSVLLTDRRVHPGSPFLLREVILQVYRSRILRGKQGRGDKTLSGCLSDDERQRDACQGREARLRR